MRSRRLPRRLRRSGDRDTIGRAGSTAGTRVDICRMRRHAHGFSSPTVRPAQSGRARRVEHSKWSNERSSSMSRITWSIDSSPVIGAAFHPGDLQCFRSPSPLTLPQPQHVSLWPMYPGKSSVGALLVHDAAKRRAFDEIGHHPGRGLWGGHESLRRLGCGVVANGSLYPPRPVGGGGKSAVRSADHDRPCAHHVVSSRRSVVRRCARRYGPSVNQPGSAHESRGRPRP
jgi:hypothetical protein